MFSTLYFIDEVVGTHLKRDKTNLKKSAETAG